MRQLREQNEILKRRLSEASAAKKAAMAQAEAQFKKQLKEVKHKGIRKMKELLAQVSTSPPNGCCLVLKLRFIFNGG